MKAFILVFISFFIAQFSWAAQVRVEPFLTTFFVDIDHYQVEFEMQMMCRYEKFIIGDTAKYEYFFKEVPVNLEVVENQSELSEVRIFLNKKQECKLGGFFKKNKECAFSFKLFLVDKIFAYGSGLPKRPIKLGVYDSPFFAEDVTFKEQDLEKLLYNKELSFIYDSNPLQVNVYFSIDGRIYDRMSSYAFAYVARDPQTGMPYRLNDLN